MADQLLKGKVGVVIGASRNLGRAIAEMLGAEGAKVAVHYNSDSAKAGADETAAAIKAAGGKAAVFQADLTRVTEVERLFDAVTKKFGHLDIMVNTAGMVLKKPLAEITEQEYDRLFAINAKAAFFCMQAAANQMSDNGRIVNIGTSLLAATTGYYSAYAGSKAPLEHFTRALAKEIGGRGITVNTDRAGAAEYVVFPSGRNRCRHRVPQEHEHQRQARRGQRYRAARQAPGISGRTAGSRRKRSSSTADMSPADLT